MGEPIGEQESERSEQLLGEQKTLKITINPLFIFKLTTLKDYMGIALEKLSTDLENCSRGGFPEVESGLQPEKTYKKEPLFITFEGGEGTGKSTQAELFHSWFLEEYGSAILTREPGGVKVSEDIRSVLLNPENEISGLTELLLFEAARTEFVEKVVSPNIEFKKSVVSDRFYDSTTAYQGYGRNLSLEIIDYLNNLAVSRDEKSYHPNLTFLIDIDPEIGLERAGKRGELNRLDKESAEFHEKVRFGFLEIAKNNFNRVVVIQGDNSVDEVQSEIKEEFSKRYL
ncbi:MAG: dTMP kinase [Nanoarchaeota archaeon]|nr:dTMP kinase [Nanoarchaeota archaeon]